MILNDKKAYSPRQVAQRVDPNQFGYQIQIPRVTIKTKYSISFLCLFDGLRTPSIRRLVRKPNMLCDKPLLTFDPSFYAPSSKSAMKEIYRNSLDIPCEIAVDPSVQTVLALLRRYTSSLPPQRVILHYCGYGVLQPNKDGCIFFFTEDRQRYKPLKIHNIVNACACPICLIIDCPNAAALKPHLLGRPDFFAFFSCSQGESLPLSMDASLDIFSSCLLQPFEASLNFHKSARQHNSVFTEQLMPIEDHHDFLLSLFNSILDAIIFETQEGTDICNGIIADMSKSKNHNLHLNPKKGRTTTQFSNMISPTIASLTRGFALAQRVMLSFNLHPTAIPELRPMGNNHLWEFWDLVLDFAATVNEPGELEKIVFALFIESFKKFPRISYIPMFALWIEKESFHDLACEALLEFLEATEKKKRRKNLQSESSINLRSIATHFISQNNLNSNSSIPNLNDSDQEKELQIDDKSIVFNESDIGKETKVLNEIKFGNKTFISYSDFDEYDKFNDISNNEISDGYYSEGNEEEDVSQKAKNEDDESDASASSYDDEESEDEQMICFDYDLISENLYECAMLGRHRKGINLSLIRSRIASASPISSKVLEFQNQTPQSLLILAKIIAASSHDDPLKPKHSTTYFPPSLNQPQAQLNFSSLKKIDELKFGMLVYCCEMKRQEIPSSFNRIMQVCIQHLDDCQPFSLILIGILLEKGGKLAFSTATAAFTSNGSLSGSNESFNSMNVASYQEVDNLSALIKIQDDSDNDDENEKANDSDSENLFYDKFERFLSSNRVDVRASAIYAIGKSKEYSQKVIDKFMMILEDEKEDNLVRGQVLYAFASFEQNSLFNKNKKSIFAGQIKERIEKVIEKEKEKMSKIKIDNNKNEKNKNKKVELIQFIDDGNEKKNLLILAAVDLKRQNPSLKIDEDANVNTFSSPSISFTNQQQIPRAFSTNSRPQQQNTKDFVNPFIDFLLTCVSSEGFSETLDSNVFKLLPYR